MEERTEVTQLRPPVKSTWITETVLITPEMARDFLKMRNNRPLSEAHAKWFAGIINRGEYVQTPSGISISPDGYVNGGQHRLRAIILAGKSLLMTVNWGVPDEVAFLQDVGKSWSMADQTKLDPHIVGVLSVFFRIVHGKRTGRQTIAQLMPYRRRFLTTILETSPSVRRGLSSAPSRAAAVLCMLDRDWRYAQVGYSNLVTKDSRHLLTKGQIYYAEWIGEQRSFSGDQLTVPTFCRGLIAFDPKYAERTYKTFGKLMDDQISSWAEHGRERICEIMGGA